MKNVFLLFFVIVAAGAQMFAQVSTQTELSTSKQSEQSKPGYFLYAKPFEVSMTVNLWGEVPQQGVYVISTNTDIIQLLSYAGGPRDKSNLEEVLVYRSTGKKDQKARVLKKINVRDILEGRSESVMLAPGDMIVVTRTPESLSWQEVLTIVNAGTSVAILGISIYTLTKK
jgi:protein involved in polysaccharide export with SLBB domain